VIDDMPRPRPPHLHKETTRHGVTVWYVRKGKGPRTRIDHTYGTDEFKAAYDAAVAGEPIAKPGKASAGSLRWLVERYRDSAAWGDLSPATRKQRDNIFRGVLEKSGAVPFKDIDRKAIVAGKERRKSTPAMARHFVEMMRGLFRWAVDAEFVAEDPTRDVKIVKPKTQGHHTWTDEECDRFEARWPLGTRERLAFDILAYTGFRRGDAAIFGRQHIRNGIITLRTEKSQGQVTVILPLLPPLERSIAAAKTGDLTFIADKHGNGLSKEGFGNWFAEACIAAGVPGRAHGLRKAGATRAANNGATESQLEAIFGWRGGGMASLYTRKANREKLARGAAALLMPEPKPNSYSRTSVSGAGTNAKSTGESDA
jgi:integrase